MCRAFRRGSGRGRFGPARPQGKPAPDIFLEAARRLKVSPDRTAIVEDALAGVKAGKEEASHWSSGSTGATRVRR